MKPFVFLSAFLIVGACAEKSYKEKIQDVKDSIEIVEPELSQQYANTITSNELKTHLYTFASERFLGRKTGERGQKLAANYLRNYYIKEDISAPKLASDYFQTIPTSYLNEDYGNTENVFGFIEGTEKPEEVVVICGHYDHLGIDDDGTIFYQSCIIGISSSGSRCPQTKPTPTGFCTQCGKYG